MRELASKDENEKVPLGNHPRLQLVVETMSYIDYYMCVFHHILSMAGDRVPGMVLFSIPFYVYANIRAVSVSHIL